jgi:uncharacterized protein (TIGR03437 family)
VKRVPFAFVTVIAAAGLWAQVSPSAYRALGQADLRQNGINRLQGVELYSPSGIALDTREGTTRLYIADTRNNRILAWADAKSYQTGDAPTLVLGQPGFQYSLPLGIGAKGLVSPTGMAVDPATGNLYVADFGNNRVVRFLNPFATPSRVEPDAVYGQANFSGRSANTGGISNNSLNAPRSVAFDPAGNLWIADTGNHRILRYNAAVLDNPQPEADIVLGQKDFLSSAANRGGTVSASGFDTPSGIAFDSQGNLYVADFNNTRVVRFKAPIAFDAAATAVYGQPNLASRGVPADPSSTTLAGPMSVAVDSANHLYVAVPLDSRIMVFALDAAAAPAHDVLGQPDFSSNLWNAGSYPLASARSLASVWDIKTDPDGNLYAADSGNNRVLLFPAGAKTATRVWGQINFSTNGVNQIKAGSINAPYKIVIDYSQSPFALYVSDTNNNRILVWRDAARFRTGDPADLVIGQPDMTTAIPNIDNRAAKPSATSLSGPKGIAVDSAGTLWVADSNNNRVLRYPRPVDQTGRITPDAVLGQPDFTSADSAAVNASSLRAPAGLSIGPDGDIFVADSGNNRILEFAPGSGTGAPAIRVYGQPHFRSSVATTPASSQTLLAPQGVFVDPYYAMYVADTGNNRVLVYANTQSAPATGSAATLVLGQESFDSTAAAAGANRLRTPTDVAEDSQGNIYVADYGNNRIVSFPWLLFVPILGASAGTVTGQPNFTSSAANWNSPDGLATPEGLYGPLGIFIDRKDTLYVGDTGNNRVLHFLKPAAVVHPAYSLSGIPVSRGSLALINGSGLSDSSETATANPLPTSLANREVVFNDDFPAPLSTFGPEQVSLQVPQAVALGAARVAIRDTATAELIAGTSVPVLDSAPGLFAGGDEKQYRAVLNENGAPNSASNPALKGSLIRIYGTGQGPLSPALPDGQAAPPDSSINTIAVPTSDGRTCLTRQPSVCVAIGNTFGDIQFSGIASGSVAIWQITVKIPAGALSGNVPVRAVINGIPTNIINVAIK